MGIIRLNNLEKRFGDNVILQNVCAEVQRGEIISVIGPSGAGKSTLLRAINFLDPPTGGEVYFDEVKINKKNVNGIRRKMGMVFQNFGLFSHMSALDNLCVGPMKLLGLSRGQAEAAAFDLLKTVGLTERAHHFPDQLSGGQKQRVAIARCLAMKPEVILFDEPTSALDPTMVGEVMAVIRNLSKTGLTILIVTHEMQFARDVSTRVFYMDEGGIYEEGSPAEIFERPQKPKTQAFIYKIRSFYFEIQSRDFDNVAMLSGIDTFCFNHAVDAAIAQKLRLIAEELVINLVVPRFGACELTVSFSDQLGRYEVSAQYPAEDIDALDSAEDHLAAMMIRGTASEVTHSFDAGVNTLKMAL
jgi:polar amino acid transport system ATP-binding protein